MRKLRTILVPIAALSLVAAACGGDDDDGSVADDTAAEDTARCGRDRCRRTRRATPMHGGWDTANHAEDTVDATQGSDLTFHMITHSDSGPFWSVVKRGMEAAAADLGVEAVWLESVNDPGVQVQLIDQAVAEGSNGIAASLPSPDQLVGPLQNAVGPASR